VLTRKSGDSTRELEAQGIEIARGDIRDSVAVRQSLEGVGVVYHLAVNRNDRECGAVNIDGTRTLLEACCASGVERFVHVSTVVVIGAVSSTVLTEEASCSPQNEYERTKYVGEQLALRFCRERGLAVTVARPACVFGGFHPEKILLNLMRQVQKGSFRFIGAENAMLNYVYVDDMAEACRAVSKQPGALGQVYNVCDPCSLRDFVGVMAKEMGISIPTRTVPFWLACMAGAASDAAAWLLRRPLPLTLGKVKTLRFRHIYSSDRLRREYPQWPGIGWQEGLRRTIQTYRSQGLLD
jgi:nucleoside-diphosphate-sugar epimerase